MNLIYIGNAEYCQSCRVALPVLEEVAATLDLPVTHLDTDTDYKEIAPLCITSLPTILIIEDNLEVGRIEGAYPKPVLTRKLQAYMH
jgi:thiol-disulfide isomerase/thioredoxin